jgi:hypothetical protein
MGFQPSMWDVMPRLVVTTGFTGWSSVLRRCKMYSTGVSKNAGDGNAGIEVDWPAVNAPTSND